MKKIVFLVLPIILLSCSSQKGQTDKYTFENDCPEQGECNLEVMQNKTLLVKNDVTTGSTYYEINDAPGRTVVKYTYSKKASEGYQDDFYDEEVLFETDSTLTSLKKGITAKEAKLVFGVKCFCRGKAGYYKVETGMVKLDDDLLTVELPDDIIDGQLTTEVIVRFK